ncbi:hypothetical protein NEAUS03_0750 [Nematocida ausubeli]|nr:hypothetical protein NEAUS03_0750 [Nematocida ausubeli]
MHFWLPFYPIQKVLPEEISSRISDTSIYVYSHTSEYEEIRTSPSTDRYQIRQILDDIVKSKGCTRVTKYSPFHFHLSTQRWVNLYSEIGKKGIISLFKKYTVLDRQESVFTLYFANDPLPVSRKEMKLREKSVLWRPGDARGLKTVDTSDIFSLEVHSEFSAEIKSLLERIKRQNTHRMAAILAKSKKESVMRKNHRKTSKACSNPVESVCDEFISTPGCNGKKFNSVQSARELSSIEFSDIDVSDIEMSSSAAEPLRLAETEKRPESDTEKTSLLEYEISQETVIRFLHMAIRKILAGIIPAQWMPRIKKKIRFLLQAGTARIPKHEILTGLRTSKGRVDNPLLYRKFITEIYNYIFLKYMPSLFSLHFRCSKGLQPIPRYFLRAEYIACSNAFKEAHLQEYFHKENEQSQDTSTFRMHLIPKKDSFRASFMKIQRNGFPLCAETARQEKMMCHILSREAVERSAWEVERKGNVPRIRTYNSIFRVTDVFPRIDAFRKKFSACFADNKPLFVLLLDVKKCFDTLPVGNGLLRKILGHAEYAVHWWNEIDKTGLSIAKKQVLYPNESAMEHTGHRIRFISHSYRDAFSQEEILEAIRKDVEGAKVLHNGQEYRRKEGIYQGSRFSSHICGYAMAANDPYLMEGLCETEIVRYVDDSLVLSWSLKEIEEVFARMKNLEETGIKLNKDKCKMFVSSPEVGMKNILVAGKVQIQYKEHFTWCGMQFDTKSLFTKMIWLPASGVRMGYSKRLIIRKIANSLNVRHIKDLICKNNPNKEKNIRLYIKCQVDRVLWHLEHPANSHLKEEILSILQEKICAIFKKHQAGSAKRIQELFQRTLLICKNKKKLPK